MVRRPIYLSHTRPDIGFTISIVIQFMHDLEGRHLLAVHRILCYLKATPGKGILFKKNNKLSLESYTDVDYAGSKVDRRSMLSYCTSLRVIL